MKRDIQWNNNIWIFLFIKSKFKYTSIEVKGCTMPPLLLNWQKVPTSKFPAMVVLNTSTYRISEMISSVSLSISVWTKATWSLQTITFPNAESLSSTLLTLIYSGIELRMFRNSKSVVVAGTSKPFLFP